MSQPHDNVPSGRTGGDAADGFSQRFQAAWESGGTSRIEEFLGSPQGDQSSMFERLLEVEIEHRRKAGEMPTPDEYHQRFPGLGKAIQAVFDRLPESSLHDTNNASGSSIPATRSASPVPSGSSPSASKSWIGKRLGNCEILDEIGIGGMGRVFKARQTSLDRIVAVKVMAQDNFASQEAVDRFKREMKLIGRLSHPNIVLTYDAGEFEGTQYLVLEYVDGKDLRDTVRDHGPLSVEKAIDYLIQAAKGLEYAHQKSIVHRDVKPGNLLLDGSGVVKVLDLGLARAIDPNPVGDSAESAGSAITTSKAILGTGDYMAPEQASDPHLVDRRADIYALGCTLFYFLHARPPFGGATFWKKVLAHSQSPIPSLCEGRADVPPALNAIFQRLMAKRPEERFATMGEVIAALQSLLGSPAVPIEQGQPRPILPPVVPRPAEKPGEPRTPPPAETDFDEQEPAAAAATWWTRRHIGLSIAAALVGLLVVVWLGWMVLGNKTSAKLDSPTTTKKTTASKNRSDADKSESSTEKSEPAPSEEQPRGAAPPASVGEPFEDPALYKALAGVLREERSLQTLRMLYTEILTTATNRQSGRWIIGATMSRDGDPREMVARNGAWLPPKAIDLSLAERDLRGESVYHELDPNWRLPEKKLVTLRGEGIRLIRTTDGNRLLTGDIPFEGALPPTLEHISIVFESAAAGQPRSGERRQALKLDGLLKSKKIPLDIVLDDQIALEQGGRFYLRAFDAARPASFYRISNDLPWTTAVPRP